MSAATVVPKARPAARRATTTSRAARPAPNRTPVRRPRPAPRAPQLRVVDTAAIRRTRRVRVGLWLLAVVGTGSLLAVVAFHVLLAQGQLELDHVEQQIAAEQKLYPKQRADVAALASPGSIMGRAGALGLVESTGAPGVVTVPPDPAAAPSSDATSTTKDYETVKRHLDPSP